MPQRTTASSTTSAADKTALVRDLDSRIADMLAESKSAYSPQKVEMGIDEIERRLRESDFAVSADLSDKLESLRNDVQAGDTSRSKRELEVLSYWFRLRGPALLGVEPAVETDVLPEPGPAGPLSEAQETLAAAADRAKTVLPAVDLRPDAPSDDDLSTKILELSSVVDTLKALPPSDPEWASKMQAGLGDMRAAMADDRFEFHPDVWTKVAQLEQIVGEGKPTARTALNVLGDWLHLRGDSLIRKDGDTSHIFRPTVASPQTMRKINAAALKQQPQHQQHHQTSASGPAASSGTLDAVNDTFTAFFGLGPMDQAEGATATDKPAQMPKLKQQTQSKQAAASITTRTEQELKAVDASQTTLGDVDDALSGLLGVGLNMESSAGLKPGISGAGVSITTRTEQELKAVDASQTTLGDVDDALSGLLGVGLNMESSAGLKPGLGNDDEHHPDHGANLDPTLTVL